MKNLIALFIIICLFACQTNSNKKKETKASNQWVSLFNGESFDGWHIYNGGSPYGAWSIEDQAMKFSPNNKKEGDPVMNLVSDKSFSNFELSLEWKISEAGNSGIFWGVQEGENLSKPYLTAPEIQIIDNERHPDAKEKPKFHQAGAVYDLVEPTKDVCNPAGQWNHFLLTIDHNKNQGSVLLNGTKINEFPLSGEKWESLIAKSKFSDECEYKRFARLKSGKISLQDHGNKVSFRNIKIRRL